MTTKLHTLRPRRFLARLRLTSEVRFGFFHGGVLRGLVSRALGQHELPAGVVPVVCEAGRVRFEAGSAYHLGLTLVGEPAAEAGSWTERLEAGLARIGAGREAGGSSSARSGTPARLEGNFRVEAVDELPVPGLPGQLEALCRSIGARASEASRETEPRSSDGASNGDLALHFLSPLRLQRPSDLQAPGKGFLDDHCFPLAHFLDRLARRLFLLEHGRYPSAEERAAFPEVPETATADPADLFWLDVPAPGRHGKPRTLGGVVGTVRLHGVPAGWLPDLVAGQHAHAGASTAFGLGRYVIAPAGEIEPVLAQDLYRPARLLLGEDGSRDALSEALTTLVEQSSEAYRRGLCLQSASATLYRAFDDGYRYALEADLPTLVHRLPRATLTARLRALYPQEPWANKLESRPEALDPSLASTLVPAILDLLEDLLSPTHRLARQGSGYAILCRTYPETRQAEARLKNKGPGPKWRVRELRKLLARDRRSVRGAR
ncbi:MAG: CRISPR system precrRNA processing endoribonuclease RAMP protein Cas6 [Acidobacteria bacterium]|nr:CRISPR system precrRNA processing endoribonuclease RAMP protein Cas6 [Acidobacteriota bacterium]